jgi:hypothetical protein
VIREKTWTCDSKGGNFMVLFKSQRMKGMPNDQLVIKYLTSDKLKIDPLARPKGKEMDSLETEPVLMDQVEERLFTLAY